MELQNEIVGAIAHMLLVLIIELALHFALNEKRIKFRENAIFPLQLNVILLK